ncbi:MAG: hypothetical protein J0H09_02910, partial [Burkholderiales bacterium]|nr:hypothetical protein [Burkholderiales bacterium]
MNAPRAAPADPRVIPADPHAASAPPSAIALHHRLRAVWGNPGGWESLATVNHSAIGLRHAGHEVARLERGMLGEPAAQARGVVAQSA